MSVIETRQELELAAFWEKVVCLACGTAQEPAEAGEGDGPACEACGSSDLHAATFLLAAAGFVETLEDDRPEVER